MSGFSQFGLLEQQIATWCWLTIRTGNFKTMIAWVRDADVPFGKTWWWLSNWQWRWAWQLDQVHVVSGEWWLSGDITQRGVGHDSTLWSVVQQLSHPYFSRSSYTTIVFSTNGNFSAMWIWCLCFIFIPAKIRQKPPASVNKCYFMQAFSYLHDGWMDRVCVSSIWNCFRRFKWDYFNI